MTKLFRKDVSGRMSFGMGRHDETRKPRIVG